MQSKVSILKDDTAGSLHDKLMEKGQELILKTINQIENGSVKTSIQTDEKELKTAHKLHKNNCKIDWSKSGVDIQNLVRGLNPYPGAWALLKNGSDKLNIKIYEVKYEDNTHSNNIGTVIANKTSIVICVEDGYIHLTNFKFPGKKQMDVKAFLNGFKFDTSAKMI
jgi:methionyl-tRNA formyltransferase